jgi:hypothetical protein
MLNALEDRIQKEGNSVRVLHFADLSEIET